MEGTIQETFETTFGCGLVWSSVSNFFLLPLAPMLTKTNKIR